jgi:hypothetical protein
LALRKLWLSNRPDRDAVKRKRHLEQAKAVAHVAKDYLALDFSGKPLSALPRELVAQAKSLLRIV